MAKHPPDDEDIDFDKERERINQPNSPEIEAWLAYEGDDFHDLEPLHWYTRFLH